MKISLDLKNITIAPAAEQFTAAIGVKFDTDLQAILTSGMNVEEKYSMTVKDITLREVLDQLLTSNELAYDIQSNRFLITTRYALAESLIAAAYPAVDLLVVRTKTGIELTSEEDFTGLIRTTVDPDSWEENGGPGSIVFSPEAMSFVVQQTVIVHRKLTKLFQNLRAARQGGVRIAQAAGLGEFEVIRNVHLGMFDDPASLGLVPDLSNLKAEDDRPSKKKQAVDVSAPDERGDSRRIATEARETALKALRIATQVEHQLRADLDDGKLDANRSDRLQESKNPG